MLYKLLLTTMALVLSLTAVALTVKPAEAFSSNRFIEMWNANVDVIDEAYDVFERGRVTPRKLERLARELARAENRIVNWLRTHRASACQRPYVAPLIKTGVSTRKWYQAAARAYHAKRIALGDRRMDRASRFLEASDRISDRMLDSCR